jgi:hypothetical protein
MNFIWRSTVIFYAFLKGYNRNEHIQCDACEKFEELHKICQPHCVCGSLWSLSENKCAATLATQQSSLILSFFRNLRSTIEQLNPDKCYFVLEGHPTFRYDLYPEYKANRIVKKASAYNIKQKVFEGKEEIVQLLSNLPITICKAHDYEADDVIATLCHNMQDEDVTICSTDTDYIQILQCGYKSCKLYNPSSKKKHFVDAPNYPYIAWKALMGDKGDNIPGLMTACIVNHVLNDPKRFEKFLSIEENRANFNINKQLIELRQIPLDDLIITDGVSNFDSLKKEFTKRNLDTLVADKYWNKFQKTFEKLKF